MDNKYLTKAIALLEGGFFVSGIGHFDISKSDLAELLEILDKPNNGQLVKDLYKRLHDYYMI